ncbi:MAG: J domain-containing protein [Spirochaetales bacterium]|nr:J domain-containing protein [Spirochaetales bacterium]
MDLASALSIYRLKQTDFTREELDRGFKNLVKKYHPDKNQEFSDWCHIRMTEINEAYELLMEHMETRAEQRKRTAPPREEKNYNPPPGRQGGGDVLLDKITALFFEGVHTYYDYELTKRSLRQEGVWRYHYRKSVKLMEKALQEMEKLIFQTNVGTGWSKFLYFGNLFLGDIQSLEPNIPLSMRGSKTHIAYSEATTNIDKAFSEYFSAAPGDREKHLSPLYRASHLLILLVENYPQTEWYNLALQKLNLLDSFLDLQDLIRSGRITF